MPSHLISILNSVCVSKNVGPEKYVRGWNLSSLSWRRVADFLWRRWVGVTKREPPVGKSPHRQRLLPFNFHHFLVAKTNPRSAINRNVGWQQDDKLLLYRSLPPLNGFVAARSLLWVPSIKLRWLWIENLIWEGELNYCVELNWIPIRKMWKKQKIFFR